MLWLESTYSNFPTLSYTYVNFRNRYPKLFRAKPPIKAREYPFPRVTQRDVDFSNKNKSAYCNQGKNIANKALDQR